MQVILADKTDTEGFTQWDATDEIVFFSFTVDIEVKPKLSTESGNENDNDDETQRNLLSEITGSEHCFIQGNMFHSYSPLEHYELILLDGKGKVLRNLWERFQEKVVISVEVSSSTPDGEKVCCISSTGIALHLPKDDASPAFTRSNAVSKLDLETISGNTSFHVKITAKIADDLVMVSNVYHLKKTFEKMLEEGVASDVVIEAENGKEIKGHKCFLISSSSVFERMFQSGMAETKNGRIDMTDVSEEGIRAFLRYLYLGDVVVPNSSISVAYDLFYAAHKYDVLKLEAVMKSYLVGRKDEDFCVNEAFEIYLFVRGIETASELNEKMIQIMSMKYDELKDLEEFKEVIQKNPAYVLEICGKLEGVSTSDVIKNDPAGIL